MGTEVGHLTANFFGTAGWTRAGLYPPFWICSARNSQQLKNQQR